WSAPDDTPNYRNAKEHERNKYRRCGIQSTVYQFKSARSDDDGLSDEFGSRVVSEIDPGKKYQTIRNTCNIHGRTKNSPRAFKERVWDIFTLSKLFKTGL